MWLWGSEAVRVGSMWGFWLMRRLGFAIATIVLLSGTSAFAQVGTPTGSAGNTVTSPESADPQTFENTQSPRNFGQSSSAFNSYVLISPSTITFESSNTNAGPYIKTESFSQVQFEFTNPNVGATGVLFDSTITPAGLGFYLANASSGCLPSQCPQIGAPDGFSGPDFGNLAPSTRSLGEVGFSFEITSSASTDALYSLSGVLLL